jgi:hypothetical protein
MENTIKVDGYNFQDLPIKNWKFYQGGKEIKSKKNVEEMIRAGIKSIEAKYRIKL